MLKLNGRLRSSSSAIRHFWASGLCVTDWATKSLTDSLRYTKVAFREKQTLLSIGLKRPAQRWEPAMQSAPDWSRPIRFAAGLTAAYLIRLSPTAKFLKRGATSLG